MTSMCMLAGTFTVLLGWALHLVVLYLVVLYLVGGVAAGLGMGSALVMLALVLSQRPGQGKLGYLTQVKTPCKLALQGRQPKGRQMAAKIFYWDWKEQPPFERIAEAVAELSGGSVHMRQVETYTDSYELVVSDYLVDDAEAERLSEEKTVEAVPLAQSLPKWWAQQVAEGNVSQGTAERELGLAPGERLAANGVVIGSGGHPDVPRFGADENDIDHPAQGLYGAGSHPDGSQCGPADMTMYDQHRADES